MGLRRQEPAPRRLAVLYTPVLHRLAVPRTPAGAPDVGVGTGKSRRRLHCRASLNFRYGSTAAEIRCLRQVRFRPDNDQIPDVA
jgi:hypothetical protein